MKQCTSSTCSTLLAIALFSVASFASAQNDITPSPSGDFGIFATVDSDLLVNIHLTDELNEEVFQLNTRASDVMKWAVGWMPGMDVVVLYSSDIGIQAYVASENQLVEVRFLDLELESHARDLYREKYGEAAPRSQLMTPDNAAH